MPTYKFNQSATKELQSVIKKAPKSCELWWQPTTRGGRMQVTNYGNVAHGVDHHTREVNSSTRTKTYDKYCNDSSLVATARQMPEDWVKSILACISFRMVSKLVMKNGKVIRTKHQLFCAWEKPVQKTAIKKGWVQPFQTNIDDDSAFMKDLFCGKCHSILYGFDEWRCPVCGARNDFENVKVITIEEADNLD